MLNTSLTVLRVGMKNDFRVRTSAEVMRSCGLLTGSSSWTTAVGGAKFGQQIRHEAIVLKVGLMSCQLLVFGKVNGAGLLRRLLIEGILPALRARRARAEDHVLSFLAALGRATQHLHRVFTALEAEFDVSELVWVRCDSRLAALRRG